MIKIYTNSYTLFKNLPVLFLVHGSSVSALPSFDLTVPGAGEYEVGSLGISIGGGGQFNASLTNGNPLDGSFFGFGEAYVNNGSSFAWK